jgi:hypothetical protein
MSSTPQITRELARHQMSERIAQASSPRVASTPPRHRVAERLRRVADRIDS